MFNVPSAGNEFKQKQCVMFFMFGKRSASIGNDVEFAFVVGLTKDGAEATLILVVAGSRVDDEGVGPILSRIVNNSEQTAVPSSLKEQRAAGRRVPPLLTVSLQVRTLRGEDKSEKLQMDNRKKLARPKNCWTAEILSMPGKIPLGVKQKPR